MLRWTPTVWLAFVAIRYGLTAGKTLREPFTNGWDFTWTVAWLVFALVVTGLSVLGKRSIANRIFNAVIIAGVLVVPVLSHTLRPAAIAFAVFAVCAGLGEFI